MKIYHLIRDDDESGVSGTGHVAWACEYPNGLVSVTFRDDTPGGPGVRSGYWYDSMVDAERIHGHGGRTRFVEMREWFFGGAESEADYVLGGQNAVQDEMENVTATVEWPENVRRWFMEKVPGATLKRLERFWAGYLDAGRRMWGKNWRAKP